jgi:carbon monoxide dehydrogenase subunit G
VHIEDSYVLDAGRSNVWGFISDPNKFGPCLPELQNLEVLDPKTFKVKVKVGILFVRGSLKFDFVLRDPNPESHVEYEGLGKGAGVSVKLHVKIDLKEKDPTTTELAWVADAELGGLLGEISPSLIQKSTGKFTQQFFSCVKSKLEPK